MLQNILQYGFPAIGVLCAIGGYFSKQRRVSLWIAGAAGVLAGVAAHYDSFWTMTTLVLTMLWAGFTALRTLDFAWRFKSGMVAAATLLALLAIWPTAHEMSGGRVPCPQYIKDRVSFRLVAGLDLRGGLRLVYTVDVEEAIRDKRDRYYEEMRQMLAVAYGLHEGDKPPSRDALAKLFEKVEMVKQRADASTIVLNLKDADPAKIEEIYNKRFFHDMSMLKEDTGKTYTFTLKTDVESVIRERAVLQAKETVNRRVDELGLREASVVVRDEDIIIEVPGQDDKQFQQIRDIISRTARLEFKILDDDQDFVGSIKKKLTDDTKLAEGVSLDNLENAPVGVGKTSPIHYATVEKKPDEQLRDALLRLKGFLEQFPPPNDRELGYGVIYDTDPETFRQTEKGWRTYFLHARADITGDQIQDASAQPDQDSSMGGWHVALTFTDSGGDRFEEITGANVKRRFAIILDNKVESAPVIQTKIAGGHAQITMGAADTQTQLEESRQLELVLRSGALPAPIVPSNEQRIGASLGEDSVREGVRATIVGALLVLIFMVVYYSRAGLIADIAVLGNMLLQLAVLSSLGASMTLPGIAGLALTLGMSVDANVLVNERIREELRAGKSPRVAVEAGYDKAFSAIIDGNLTTVLSALVLAQYGTGPIKGFAVTLLVGLIANLFTAVFATRVIFDYLVRARKVKTLRIG